MNNTSYQLSMARNTSINMIENVAISSNTTFEGTLILDTNPNITNAVMYIIDSSNSDIQNVTDGITFSNIRSGSESYQLSVNTSYSISGSTTLTHSLASYNDTTVLNWVSLDSVNKILTLNTTDKIGTYALYLKTETDSYQDQNLITIQVVNCTVQNCKDCQSDIDT